MFLKNSAVNHFSYFSSPGLSWDAMLKTTGVKLELISDIEEYLFIEQGLTGGVSYIC